MFDEFIATMGCLNKRWFSIRIPTPWVAEKASRCGGKEPPLAFGVGLAQVWWEDFLGKKGKILGHFLEM